MDDLERLKSANDAFYEAIEALDILAMERVWLHRGWVRCVHPGREPLVGWPLVRRSWEQVFADTRWLRVAVTEVTAEIVGELGIVACSQNMTSAHSGEVGVAVAQATNLFRRTRSGWRLMHHHASPAPLQVTEGFSGRLQ